MPFLSPGAPASSGSAAAAQRARYLTTQRQRYFWFEAYRVARYTAYMVAISAAGFGLYAVLQEQGIERRYPTPREWSYFSRVFLRGNTFEEARKDVVRTNWVLIGEGSQTLIERLEDPTIDGAGIRRLLLDGEEGESAAADGGLTTPGTGASPLSVDGVGTLGFDITSKSEPWRRGYYQALMSAGRAAEHLDGWVVDPTQNNAWFPPEVVLSETNPRPAPLPSDFPARLRAPRDVDCRVGYRAPEAYYMRVLTTRGFTARQKLDAALAYANWLDFKALHDAAGAVLEWALGLATEGDADAQRLYDHATFVLRDAAASARARPSPNLLAALTAVGTHKAQAGDAAGALPVFLSLLRARRSLPDASPSPPSPAGKPSKPALSAAAVSAPQHHAADRRAYEDPVSSTLDSLMSLVREPPYPAPPADDGSAPLLARDAAGACMEAALTLWIGEILWATAPDAARQRKKGAGADAAAAVAVTLSRGQEEGLAWTREAVDVAEETLHRLLPPNSPAAPPTTSKKAKAAAAAAPPLKEADREAVKTCRECLTAALGNWDAMAGRLAAEEKAREQRRAAAAKDGAADGSASSSGSWFPTLWGVGSASRGPDSAAPLSQPQQGRWAVEEKLVAERRRRAREVLMDGEDGPTGMVSRGGAWSFLGM